MYMHVFYKNMSIASIYLILLTECKVLMITIVIIMANGYYSLYALNLLMFKILL